MGCPGAPRTERPLAGGRLAVWDGGGIRAGQLPWLQGEVKSKQVFLPSPFHSKDRGAGGLGACSRVCVLAGARVTQGLFFLDLSEGLDKKTPAWFTLSHASRTKVI